MVPACVCGLFQSSVVRFLNAGSRGGVPTLVSSLNMTSKCISLDSGDVNADGVADLVCAGRTEVVWGTLYSSPGGVVAWKWSLIASNSTCITSVALADMVCACAVAVIRSDVAPKRIARCTLPFAGPAHRAACVTYGRALMAGLCCSIVYPLTCCGCVWASSSGC